MLGWNETHKRVEIGQYLPVGVSGHSCRGHNDDVLVQIEMIGYAEETLWLPGGTKKNPHPETLDALASLMNVCWHEWGIPLVHPFQGRRLWLSWQFATEYTSEGRKVWQDCWLVRPW
jgi:hypothetical protein